MTDRVVATTRIGCMTIVLVKLSLTRSRAIRVVLFGSRRLSSRTFFGMSRCMGRARTRRSDSFMGIRILAGQTLDLCEATATSTALFLLVSIAVALPVMVIAFLFFFLFLFFFFLSGNPAIP